MFLRDRFSELQKTACNPSNSDSPGETAECVRSSMSQLQNRRWREVRVPLPAGLAHAPEVWTHSRGVQEGKAEKRPLVDMSSPPNYNTMLLQLLQHHVSAHQRETAEQRSLTPYAAPRPATDGGGGDRPPDPMPRTLPSPAHHGPLSQSD